MNYKKFRSVGADIIVTSLSGHSAIISKEFISLPDVLWPSAYSAGAIADDVVVSDVDSYVKKVLKETELRIISDREAHKKLFKEALENPNSYVSANGKLKYSNFIALIGEPLKNFYIDELWEEVTKEGEVDKKGRPLNTGE